MKPDFSLFFQGNWEDDDRNGWGELTYNSGDKYRGDWLDDKQRMYTMFTQRKIYDLSLTVRYLLSGGFFFFFLFTHCDHVSKEHLRRKHLIVIWVIRRGLVVNCYKFKLCIGK